MRYIPWIIGGFVRISISEATPINCEDPIPTGSSMAYHDDLLAHALSLVQASPPSELTLRRAVSSAYYAVFHLLIFEATEHWDSLSLRSTLGRAYDHSLMRTTSNRILDGREFPYTNENPVEVRQLREIAQGFGQLQEDRHFADYNLTKLLDPVDALRQVKVAEKIFTNLPTIKTRPIVVEYLTLLLVKRR